MGREVGGGIGMGKTCEPKAFSFQCMTKFTTHKKNKKKTKHLGSQTVEVSLDASVVQSLSHVRLFATPWTRAHQAPLSMGFSKQEYWSGLPFPSPRDLPDPGIKSASPALAGGFFTTEPPGK